MRRTVQFLFNSGLNSVMRSKVPFLWMELGNCIILSSTLRAVNIKWTMFNDSRIQLRIHLNDHFLWSALERKITHSPTVLIVRVSTNSKCRYLCMIIIDCTMNLSVPVCKNNWFINRPKRFSLIAWICVFIQSLLIAIGYNEASHRELWLSFHPSRISVNIAINHRYQSIHQCRYRSLRYISVESSIYLQ